MPIKWYEDRPDRIRRMYQPENPMRTVRHMSRGTSVITVSGVNRYGEKSHILISEEDKIYGKNVIEESEKYMLR